MKARENLKKWITAALLIALIVLLGNTPIGLCNIGVIKISFLCVPVVIGILALGFRYGLLIAAAFGTVSFISSMQSPAGLVSPILAKNVIWLIVLCYVPRLLIPVTVLSVQKLVEKKSDNCAFLAIPSAIGSLTNTVFYLGFILIMYQIIGVENPTLLATLGGIVLTAGLPEAAACALICPSIILALRKAKLIGGAKKPKDR